MPLSQNLKSLEKSGIFQFSENMLRKKCKAKYAVTSDGELRLLAVQEFSQPRFMPKGWEMQKSIKHSSLDLDIGEDIVLEPDEQLKFANTIRAVRRAKIACFDMIQCNPELDTFATLTLSPDTVGDRTDWDSAYGVMRGWLSNRVQRNDLKYICVPEHHKDGKSIHFHAVMNSEALNLEKARYPDTGRLMKHKGQQVYNVADFTAGFTTAKLISGESATDKVAKYIFKYMGKQMGQKIGGRYYLHGGRLSVPLCRYSDDPSELIPEGVEPTHTKELEITGNLTYKEYYYV